MSNRQNVEQINFRQKKCLQKQTKCFIFRNTQKYSKQKMTITFPYIICAKKCRWLSDYIRDENHLFGRSNNIELLCPGLRGISRIRDENHLFAVRIIFALSSARKYSPVHILWGKHRNNLTSCLFNAEFGRVCTFIAVYSLALFVLQLTQYFWITPKKRMIITKFACEKIMVKCYSGYSVETHVSFTQNRMIKTLCAIWKKKNSTWFCRGWHPVFFWIVGPVPRSGNKGPFRSIIF